LPPPTQLDGLELEAVRQGQDDRPTTIIDETFGLIFGLKGPLTECGSRDLLAQVFGERRFLLAPWMRTELHILRDPVKGYLARMSGEG
jgi:hypothetical protein